MSLIPTVSDHIQKHETTLPMATLFRYPLNRAGTLIKGFLQSRYLIIGMAVLQILWLAAILWTGTSSNVQMIRFLVIYSFCAGLIMIFLPDAVLSQIRTFKAWLLQNQARLFFALGLLTLLGGIFYASNQQTWGDEERSLRVAKIISAKGLESAYQESGWLSKKHPPLMPLLYSIALDAMGTSLFHLRLVSLLFLAATVAVTYFLGLELYDRNTGYLASFLFLLFPLVIRLGTSAMMDIQLTFFFALALLVSLRLMRTPSFWLAILTGFVIGLGLLTKYTMVLIFGVLIICIVFLPTFRRQKFYFLLASLVSISMFSGWLLYANHIGILAGQIEKIKQFSGIYYLFNNTDGEIQPAGGPAPATTEIDNSAGAIQNGILKLGLETLFTRLPSSLGVHHLPLIVFGALFLLKRRKLSDWFILFWIGVVFIVLFLTLPDHRYFLPAFPAIAIMISRMFKRFSDFTERAVLLSFLFLGANLYLFVDWVREAHLFL
jgi:4-amino-4-deoxy-L-arabinose transferase-like glycosyltransferase